MPQDNVWFAAFLIIVALIAVFVMMWLERDNNNVNQAHPMTKEERDALNDWEDYVDWNKWEGY